MLHNLKKNLFEILNKIDKIDFKKSKFELLKKNLSHYFHLIKLDIKFCIPVKVVSSAEKLLNSLFDYLNYQEAPEFRGVARLDNFIMSHKNSILSL